MTRQVLAHGLSIAGIGAVLVGSVLPWVHGEDVSYGTTVLDGQTVLGARQGMAGGDAWISLAFGVLAALLWLLSRWRDSSATRRLGIVLGGLSTLWALASWNSIPDEYRSAPGLWLVAAGGLLIVAGGFVRPESADARYNARLTRMQKRWAQGRPADAIALQQDLVDLTLRGQGWSRTAGINAMLLAGLHAEASNRPLCEEIMGTVLERCMPAFDDADRHLVRAMYEESYRVLAERGA